MFPLLWWTILLLLWLLYIAYALWIAVMGARNGYGIKPYLLRDDPVYGITSMFDFIFQIIFFLFIKNKLAHIIVPIFAQVHFYLMKSKNKFPNNFFPSFNCFAVFCTVYYVYAIMCYKQMKAAIRPAVTISKPPQFEASYRVTSENETK